MNINLKYPVFRGRKVLIILLITAISIGFFPFLKGEISEIKADDSSSLLDLIETPKFLFFQENTLLPLSNPANPEPEIVGKMKVIITGYSSSPWETDDEPYITAAGTQVREGIVANNVLPFGTKIRIPELYGGRIFVVEDRMSWQKGNYQIDIWFPDYWQALNFGAKRTYIEILEA